jgi:hypothetical protein
MLAFEPISCAMVLSALEQVCCRRHDRVVCTKAKIWIRRAPADVLMDVAMSEVSDGALDVMNTIDTGVLLTVLVLMLMQLILRLRAF